MVDSQTVQPLCLDSLHISKYLIHIDSSACSQCKISEFIIYQKLFELSRSSNKFVPIILLTPKANQVDGTIEHLIQTDWDFPVYVDSGLAFGRLNPVIPNDNRLHSVLIDNNNNPILIGDPIANSQIMDMLNDYIYNK